MEHSDAFTRRELHHDEGENTTTLVTWQDVEPLIEANKRLQNEQQTSETFRLVARIDNVHMLQWFNEEVARGNSEIRWMDEQHMRIAWRKVMFDPDYKWLRTT